MQNNATRRAVDACQRWSDLAIRKQLPLWVWPPDPVNHTSAVDPRLCRLLYMSCTPLCREGSETNCVPVSVHCGVPQYSGPGVSPVYGGPEIWAGNVT